MYATAWPELSDNHCELAYVAIDLLWGDGIGHTHESGTVDAGRAPEGGGGRAVARGTRMMWDCLRCFQYILVHMTGVSETDQTKQRESKLQGNKDSVDGGNNPKRYVLFLLKMERTCRAKRSCEHVCSVKRGDQKLIYRAGEEKRGKKRQSGCCQPGDLLRSRVVRGFHRRRGKRKKTEKVS